MEERDYPRDRASRPLAGTSSYANAQLHSRNSSTSIHSNITGSSSSSSSGNLSNLSELNSLSDPEEADYNLPNTSVSTVRGPKRSQDAAVNGEASSHRETIPTRQPYTRGLSTISVGIRGFQSNILSPAQRIAKESLPSPPATSKEGESERGSIGSARGQTKAEQAATRRESKRPSLVLDDMQAYQPGDAFATVRRSPVNAFPAAQQPSSGHMTSPKVQSSSSFKEGTPSSAARSPSLEISAIASSSSSNLSRSRSRSPLAETGNHATSISHNEHTASPRVVADFDKLSFHPRDDYTPSQSYAASQLSRTSSTASGLSRHGSVVSNDKGKGREKTPSPVVRKTSMSASKIRKAGEASRARMYSASASEESLSDNISTSHKHSNTSAKGIQQEISPSSSRSLIAENTQDRVYIEPAVSTGIVDGHATLRRTPSTISRSHLSDADSEAFVRTNRNSVINLASRRNANHLPSPGLQEQIDVDISSGLANADRSLEEGEILEETPPAEMDKLYSHSERRLRSPSPHEIGQLRSSQYSNGTSDSRRSGDSHVTRPASRSSFLSPPTLRNVPERSVTPSPASSSGEFPSSLEALDRRPANGELRYSQHRTPHRSNRPSSRPSTADSNDLRSRHASDPVRDHFVDDLSRTPRRTPAHRRYESELLPSEERPLDSRRSARGNESQSERSLYSARSHSSLDRYVESDRRSAYSTPFSRGERRDLHRSQRHDDRSSQQPEPSHHTPASGRLSSLYLDRSDRPEAQYSARSARSYTSSNHRSGQGAASQRSISPSASTRGINERPASIVGGRTTPRYTDRPASRVGTTRSSIAESQSIRSLAGFSIDNIDKYESRTRARTVSNRSTSDVDGVRSERQNDASSRPDRDERANFRTMPSSQSRSRLALRDLEVGSQDWWQEVSEIREKANNVANDRPMSRTSTRRSLASLASPESVPSTSERAARSRTDGRGVAPSASSRASLVDIAASQRPGSAAAVYDAKDHLRQTERPYTPQTRISDQPMSNGTASGQRRTHQAPQSPSTGEDHPHHKLLRDALFSLQETHQLRVGGKVPEAADIERVAGALVDVAIRQSNITSALWKEIADSQIEAELASDTEDGARSSSRRNVVLLSRLERTSAQSRRLADEQVRALTELFLLWRNASRPSQLENPNRRRSLADTPLSSSPVTRSATLPSGQPVRQYALPLTDGRNTPASVRRPRHINTLERIDSHTDDTISQAPHSHTQSGRTEINVPSPRSLQRAKSSSTSQVSQNTVKGYIASSPTKNDGDYFMPDSRRSESPTGSRVSRRSLEGLNGDSPAHEDGLEVADRSAINSLESQLASKGAEKSASYRWRPFQQKRTGPQASDELPDSPAIAAGEVRQNRSSELARTLSRMSSRVLR